MRTAMMMGAALLCGGTASAQHGGAGASYPQPGRVVVHGPNRPMPATPMRPSRWGSSVDGRWWGGANAPGGWSAYRRPVRGYRLPTYWVSPRFHVTDWRGYGLTEPAGGYQWVRYYDDAVMIDRGGSVYDHRDGIDWDREPNATDGGYDDRRPRSGAGGAIAGAVAGGIVGNVVAGRGDRLGGTLLGAGVGAAAGLAIDRATDPARKDRRGYDAYRTERGEPPIAPDRAPPYHGDDERGGHHDDSGYDHRHDRTVVMMRRGHDGGYGTRSYSTAGGPVIVHAPYGSATTVTVAHAPVITTTTTTEYYEDAVTYTRAPVVKRKAYATKRVYRAETKPRCVCR